MFCATTATIVSGAMAERTQFRAYFVYCIFISALVYPLAGHWTWGGGWLAALGFHDFAGSAVVHSVGGWLALVGAALVGPRIGKYKNGKPRAILGHNLTIATLGVFILWIGWFGFNPGSTVGIATPALQESASQVFMNTNIAAATGALTALFAAWFRYGKPSLSLSLNGVLAGLVGITAGCDAVTPAGAAAIGILCGMAMVFAVNFFDAVVKVDDPVGAISVHGVCGSLGTVLTGVFATDGGLFYGGGWRMLGIQTLGAAVYAAWALVCGLILFGTIRSTIDCASIAASKRTDSTTTNTAKHPTTADPAASGAFRSAHGGVQRLFDVGDQVIDMLRADGEAHRGGRDPLRGQLLGRKLRVGGRRRVDHQRLHVGDVRKQREDLQRVDETVRLLLTAADLEGEDRAAALREIPFIERVVGMAGSAGWFTRTTPGWCDRYSTTFRAFCTCRSTRSERVSSPCNRMKALKGESAAPVSRSKIARMRTA